MSKDLIDYAVNGDFKGVKECIKNGADINTLDDNISALSRATGSGHIEIVQYLVGNGSDVNMKDEKGRVALDIVCSNPNRSDVVKFLESLNK